MQIHNQLRNMCLAAVIGGILAASPLAAQTLGRISISGTTVIDEAGSYVLVTDLSLSANSTADAAIKITASGVTVDLNGHQITGPGGLLGVGILAITGSRRPLMAPFGIVGLLFCRGQKLLQLRHLFAEHFDAFLGFLVHYLAPPMAS